MVANLAWWSASLITWITSMRLHPGYSNLTLSQVKIFFGPDDHLRPGSGAPEGLDGRLAIHNNINLDFFSKAQRMAKSRDRTLIWNKVLFTQ
ncbi:hypothetical protein AVEN_259133-1 [Araneus ventricosus]|uniref:Uncharacterized protein n=1 Tax=Araneus ventricosus TaxID=182803 RepID=A0A4Y2RHJ4_ARAVE|nr:hypothetical protein AVEN_262627-1 [Araneus ventricosus]GBN75257.1 hypothetical protein AVEN_259133-1 [Araneus ventricosus]